MYVNIEHWTAWAGGLDKQQLTLWAQNKLPFADAYKWPTPNSVDKAQRRRLSPLAKIIMSQIEEIEGAANLPSVFSTRHGDLPKTISLLEDVGIGEDLSPTQFALSVHNAVSGQFSMVHHNIQPSNVVSGGKDSLLCAVIDATSRLTNSDSDNILLVHADMPLPDAYQRYQDEQQIPHCLILKLSKKACTNRFFIEKNALPPPSFEDSSLPIALQISKQLALQTKCFDIYGKHLWRWVNE